MQLATAHFQVGVAQIQEWVLCPSDKCRLPECQVNNYNTRDTLQCRTALRWPPEPHASFAWLLFMQLVVEPNVDPPISFVCSACGCCAGQKAGLLSKQAKLVKHILANPPKQKGGTQNIGHGAQSAVFEAEAAIDAAAAVAAAAPSPANDEDDGHNSSVDSVDSESGEDEVGCRLCQPQPETEPEPEPVAATLAELVSHAFEEGGWKAALVAVSRH